MLKRKKQKMPMFVKTALVTAKLMSTYKERPHRLKYTYAMPQFSPNGDVITIAIEPDGKGGSIMTYTHEGPDVVEELASVKAGAMSESEKGWRKGLDLMESAFKTKRYPSG